jgi:hypothetical protein
MSPCNVQPAWTTVARVAKPPTSDAAMFFETNETAPYSFAYCVWANHELCRQLIGEIVASRHAISRSFANAASLLSTVHASAPQASEFG